MIAAAFIVIGAVLVGVTCGLLTYLPLRKNAYKQGRLDERREQALTSAGYMSSVTWNSPEIPIGRHRFLNRKTPKPPAPQPPRPVFHREARR